MIPSGKDCFSRVTMLLGARPEQVGEPLGGRVSAAPLQEASSDQADRNVFGSKSPALAFTRYQLVPTLH